MKNIYEHNNVSLRLIADRFAGKFPVKWNGREAYRNDFIVGN